MDANRFDGIARALDTTTARRGLLAGVAGLAIALAGSDTAAKGKKGQCKSWKVCKGKTCCKAGDVCKGKKCISCPVDGNYCTNKLQCGYDRGDLCYCMTSINGVQTCSSMYYNTTQASNCTSDADCNAFFPNDTGICVNTPCAPTRFDFVCINRGCINRSLETNREAGAGEAGVIRRLRE